jgi:hypothetical protein
MPRREGAIRLHDFFFLSRLLSLRNLTRAAKRDRDVMLIIITSECSWPVMRDGKSSLGKSPNVQGRL